MQLDYRKKQKLHLTLGALGIILALLLIFITYHSSQSSATQTKKSSSAPLEPAINRNNINKKYLKETTLVQTDDPTEVIKHAAQEGLTSKVIDQPDSPAIVKIESDSDSSRIKSLKKKLPSDTKISSNKLYQATGSFNPNDTYYPDQWNLDKINAPSGWDISTGSESTVLAVIDSGVLFDQAIDGTTFTQADFPIDKKWLNPGESDTLASNGIDDDSNGFIDDWQGWDFMGGHSGNSVCPNFDQSKPVDSYVYEDNDPQPYSCDSPMYPTQLNKSHYNGTCVAFESACFVGHGTLVGSTAAAKTNNGQLIAGVDPSVSLMNLRVLDGYGYTDSSIVSRAVRYATLNGADVINLSLSTTSCSEGSIDVILEDALSDAVNAGVTIIAASGNGGSDIVCYPASSQYTIAVGATDKNDQRASFSSGGSALDVVAPGVNIPAANAPSNASPATYYSDTNGTSLATPHVTALATLLKSVKPDLTPSQIRQYIISGADKVNAMNGNNYNIAYGYGRINVYNSLRLTSLTHPDGTLVRITGDPKVYLIDDGYRRHVSSRDSLESHGFKWSHIRSALPNDMALPLGVPLSIREGALLRGTGDAVYVVDATGDQLSKRHISSPAVLLGLGFEWSDIVEVPDSQLPSVNGAALKSVDIHPDGILVQAPGDAKVYLIENQKRRHVKSREVLYSHGFDFSQVKGATANDRNLPVDSPVDFRVGTTVRSSSNPNPVYVISYSTEGIEKRHIASRVLFELLDYKHSQVLRVGGSQLPSTSGVAID